MAEKKADWFDPYVDALEKKLFPHQESEEEQEAFTKQGRARVKEFLKEFDNCAFEDGYNAHHIEVPRPGQMFDAAKFVKKRAKAYKAARP